MGEVDWKFKKTAVNSLESFLELHFQARWAYHGSIAEN